VADYQHYEMTVIVPSRGRPGNIARLAKAFRETGAGPAVELLVAVDLDDPALPEYRRVYEAGGVDTLAVGQRQGLAGWTNQLALDRVGHVFAVTSLGDDHVPRTHGWAQRFLGELRAMGSGFVYGDDGLQGERLPTAVAVTSDIVSTLGWLCLPELRHLYVDDVWRELGRAAGRIRYLPDVLIEHMHPFAGKAQLDAGYREVNAAGHADADRLVFEAWMRDGLAADVARLRALGVAAWRA
jgi:hypothetical protein